MCVSVMERPRQDPEAPSSRRSTPSFPQNSAAESPVLSVAPPLAGIYWTRSVNYRGAMVEPVSNTPRIWGMW